MPKIISKALSANVPTPFYYNRISKEPSAVIATISETKGVSFARKQSKEMASHFGHAVLNMPQLISALRNKWLHSCVRGENSYHNRATLSYETFAEHEGKQVYAVMHGYGVLNRTDVLISRLEEAREARQWWHPQIKDWQKISVSGKLIHVEDAKKGNLPKEGGYGIFVPCDAPNMYDTTVFDKETFMLDDRFIAFCGGVEYREALADIFFNREGHKNVKGYYGFFAPDEKKEEYPSATLLSLNHQNFHVRPAPRNFGSVFGGFVTLKSSYLEKRWNQKNSKNEEPMPPTLDEVMAYAMPFLGERSISEFEAGLAKLYDRTGPGI